MKTEIQDFSTIFPAALANLSPIQGNYSKLQRLFVHKLSQQSKSICVYVHHSYYHTALTSAEFSTLRGWIQDEMAVYRGVDLLSGTLVRLGTLR